MIRINDILSKLRSAHRNERGVAMVMATLFLGSVGVTVFFGLYAISRVSSTKAYINGVARDAAYASVQQNVDANSTASGGGGVQIFNDSNTLNNVKAFIDTSNTNPGDHPGITDTTFFSDANTQVHNTLYSPDANQALANGSCPLLSPYCWTETAVGARRHYTSGMNVGVQADVQIINPIIPFSNVRLFPLIGFSGAIQVHASGAADWGQSCVNASRVEVTCGRP